MSGAIQLPYTVVWFSRHHLKSGPKIHKLVLNQTIVFSFQMVEPFTDQKHHVPVLGCSSQVGHITNLTSTTLIQDQLSIQMVNVIALNVLY